MTFGSSDPGRMRAVVLQAVSGLLIVTFLSACATTGQQLPVTSGETPVRGAEAVATVSEADRKACEELAEAQRDRAVDAWMQTPAVSGGKYSNQFYLTGGLILLPFSPYGWAVAPFLYPYILRERSKVAGKAYTETMAECLGESAERLAALHLAQGKYAEAEPLYRQVLAIREQAPGPEHPDTAATVDAYATVLRYMNREAEEEKAAARAAKLYAAQGNYAKADLLYRRVLAIREKTLGPEHLDVAEILLRLGDISVAQGNHADEVGAETLYKRALAIQEQALGPEHAQVVPSLNRLADRYAAQGEYTEAGPLYQRLLTIQEATLGPEHPDVARILDAYALVLRKLNRAAEAEEMTTRAQKIRFNSWGI